MESGRQWADEPGLRNHNQSTEDNWVAFGSLNHHILLFLKGFLPWLCLDLSGSWYCPENMARKLMYHFTSFFSISSISGLLRRGCSIFPQKGRLVHAGWYYLRQVMLAAIPDELQISGTWHIRCSWSIGGLLIVLQNPTVFHLLISL